MNLGIVQQIPQHLPEAVAVEGAEDRDGAGVRGQVHPGLAEALDNVIHLGPQGHHPDGPPGIDDRQSVGEMQGLEFHTQVYTKNTAIFIWDLAGPDFSPGRYRRGLQSRPLGKSLPGHSRERRDRRISKIREERDPCCALYKITRVGGPPGPPADDGQGRPPHHHASFSSFVVTLSSP